jgi:hypothetical protein
MINSDILSPDEILPNIIIIDAFQYLSNIFYLNIINSFISEFLNFWISEYVWRSDITNWYL